MLSPARSPGGHRWYAPSDVHRVARLRWLVSEGLTVAAAARSVVAAGSGAPPGITMDESVSLETVAAALTATRALVWADTPAGVVDAVVGFVEAIGGAVYAAAEAPPTALPIDLAFGERSPLLADAEEYSPARLHLERYLPTLVEDARHAIAALRARRDLGS